MVNAFNTMAAQVDGGELERARLAEQVADFIRFQIAGSAVVRLPPSQFTRFRANYPQKQ
jgi:hypothetical protein